MTSFYQRISVLCSVHWDMHFACTGAIMHIMKRSALILNQKQSIYNKAFSFPTKVGLVYIAPFNLKVPVKVSKVCC